MWCARGGARATFTLDVAAPHFLTDHEVAAERIGKCTEEFRTVFEFQEYRQSNNDKPLFGTPTPNQNGSG
jgi:hypothetical protein